MNKKAESFSVKKTPHCFTETGVVIFAESSEAAKKEFEKMNKKSSKN